MKKAVIYGFFRFPRMSANANFSQYLALALKEIGYDVTIISAGDISQCEYNSEKKEYFYNGIRFHPYELKKGKISHFMDYSFGLGFHFIDAIKTLDLQKGDIAIGYIPDGIAVNLVHNYCKKRGIVTAQCVDELFGLKELCKMSLIFRKNYKYAIEKVIPRSDYIFPISHYIQDYYKQFGSKTFVIPIMADPQEYDNNHFPHEDIVKIIYPANGMIKDSFDEMLEALCQLPSNILAKIEFNITGMKKENINVDLYDKVVSLIGNRFVLHTWLEYDELINLYKQVDFLLLARKTNQMTRANFPSKVPEVMTYGVIPIVSKVGDYTQYYLTNDKDSIVFDGFRSEECCKAIIRAVSIERELRVNMSNEAKKTVSTKFDYRVWSDKIKIFLEKESVL